MLFQSKWLDLYSMNMVTVNSRGANQATREDHDRDGQILVATDFNNILDNEEDVEAEAMEAIDPHSYVPKSNTSHKPPKVSPSEVPRNEDTINENAQSGIRGHGQGQAC